MDMSVGKSYRTAEEKVVKLISHLPPGLFFGDNDVTYELDGRPFNYDLMDRRIVAEIDNDSSVIIARLQERVKALPDSSALKRDVELVTGLAEAQLSAYPSGEKPTIVLASENPYVSRSGYQTHGLFYSFDDALMHVRKDAQDSEIEWEKKNDQVCELSAVEYHQGHHIFTRWVASREPIRARQVEPEKQEPGT